MIKSMIDAEDTVPNFDIIQEPIEFVDEIKVGSITICSGIQPGIPARLKINILPAEPSDPKTQ